MSEHIIKGNIFKTILNLSWPIQVAFVLQAAFNLVDTLFVGRIGPDAIAALSLAFPVFVLMFSLAGGFGVGTTSLISRYLGAKNIDRAIDVGQNSLILAFLMTAFFMITGFFLIEPLYIWMGAEGAVLDMVLEYTQIVLAGSIFMFLVIAGGSIIRGEGDMKTPMVYIAVSSAVNIILDPFLIWGWGPFPEMGFIGTAVATVIAVALACAMTLWHLFGKNIAVRMNLKEMKFDWRIMRRIVELGFTSSLAHSLLAIGIVFLTRIVAGFGSEAIAAFGIGYRLDMIAVLPALGLTLAMVTIVGHNVGANKLFRVIKATVHGSLLIAAEMAIIGLLFFMAPELFLRMFTDDTTLISMGIDYLVTVGLTYAFIGVGLVIGSVFQGAGTAVPILVITLSRVVIFPIILALFIQRTMDGGVESVWTAIALSNVLSAIIAIAWLLNSELYQKSLASEARMKEFFL